MASDQSAALNPFTSFAYQPELLEPSSSSMDEQKPLVSTIPSQKLLGKRKATNSEGSSSLMHSKAPGSKKVKIYKNLRGLDDHLQSGLDIIFCGINPGQKSSQIGHHYSNPTNHFWSCLHQSGLTSRLLSPLKDYTLPQEFSIGLTDLVSRPTIKQSELSKAEQVTGVTELMQKITQHRPRITCFVGLGIAEIVKMAVLTGKSKTAVGLQPYKVIYPDGNPSETLFYMVASTSGRVVQYQKSAKVQQFTDLRVLVDKMKKGGLDTEELVPIDMKSPGTPEAT